ncbi:MAG: MBL fold metallo-hydrolase [Desulfurococcales archaeon]|nr:MBL fold metallo-hydrolase [Desulfurococcales archaeon]
MIRIKWCGHSYIVIETDYGSIAVDPHDGGSIGLPECRVEADIVLVTHDHYDHNAVEHARGRKSKVIKWDISPRDFGWSRIHGYKYYHDKASGSLRGSVVAYRIELPREELAVVHLSDIGHIPPREALTPLMEVDVLALPVGGVITVNALEAWELVRILKPKLVVPLHFWMPGSIVPLDPLERFLQISKARRLRVEGGEIPVEKADLPGKSTIIVFETTITGRRTLMT